MILFISILVSIAFFIGVFCFLFEDFIFDFFCKKKIIGTKLTDMMYEMIENKKVLISEKDFNKIISDYKVVSYKFYKNINTMAINTDDNHTLLFSDSTSLSIVVSILENKYNIKTLSYERGSLAILEKVKDSYLFYLNELYKESMKEALKKMFKDVPFLKEKTSKINLDMLEMSFEENNLILKYEDKKDEFCFAIKMYFIKKHIYFKLKKLEMSFGYEDYSFILDYLKDVFDDSKKNLFEVVENIFDQKLKVLTSKKLVC